MTPAGTTHSALSCCVCRLFLYDTAFPPCSVESDALLSELNDLKEMMASEAASRAALQDQLDASERQLGEIRNELDMTKTVSCCRLPVSCTAGAVL